LSRISVSGGWESLVTRFAIDNGNKIIRHDDFSLALGRFILSMPPQIHFMDAEAFPSIPIHLPIKFF
jgi:hypothetical protein